MPEETQTHEYPYRFNVKQTSKGERYCEFTVKADNFECLKTRVERMKKLVAENSTVGEPLPTEGQTQI